VEIPLMAELLFTFAATGRTAQIPGVPTAAGECNGLICQGCDGRRCRIRLLCHLSTELGESNNLAFLDHFIPLCRIEKYLTNTIYFKNSDEKYINKAKFSGDVDYHL
jgi:hypothetical protein